MRRHVCKITKLVQRLARSVPDGFAYNTEIVEWISRITNYDDDEELDFYLRDSYFYFTDHDREVVCNLITNFVRDNMGIPEDSRVTYDFKIFKQTLYFWPLADRRDEDIRRLRKENRQLMAENREMTLQLEALDL